LTKEVLKQREFIYLSSKDILVNYRGLLKTAARDENEKFICRGWYRYLDHHRPGVGDLLLFNMDSRSDYLYVKLIRKNRRQF
jgi:hypothetical protein